jgi:predicted secreted Zn-dependent protease
MLKRKPTRRKRRSSDATPGTAANQAHLPVESATPELEPARLREPATREAGAAPPLRGATLLQMQRTLGNAQVAALLSRRAAATAVVQRKGGNKSAGKTTINPPKRASYTIDAQTLHEVADVIGAREEAGETTWEPNLNYKTSSDGVVTQATVTVDLTITMPEWPAARKRKKRVRDEWERFFRALDAHEQGHVDLVRKHLEGVAASLVGLSEEEAQQKFAEALQELQDASDQYDADTDHGRKHGTIIDLSVAEDENENQ